MKKLSIILVIFALSFMAACTNSQSPSSSNVYEVHSTLAPVATDAPLNYITTNQTKEYSGTVNIQTDEDDAMKEYKVCIFTLDTPENFKIENPEGTTTPFIGVTSVQLKADLNILENYNGKHIKITGNNARNSDDTKVQRPVLIDALSINGTALQK
ncbi:MAG: hypothetical protein Q8876_04730 [Bacillota bacterium]|nr:hypothetical protein [Bacillota bacterium]